MAGEGKRGMVVWIILTCIVAAVGSSYAMLRFMGKGNLGGEGNVAVEEQAVTLGPIYEAGEFTVDLLPEGRSRLLRVSVSLQTTSPKAAKTLADRSIQVKDTIVSILRGHTPSSLTGRTGMEKLRHEINTAINDRVVKGAVSDVYFPDLVMQ